MATDRLRSFFVGRGGLLAVFALAAYLVLAPSYIVDGDNAEFATLGEIGGTAHPTGYPLYLLWLRATSWLPGASPAHTANLATAILGAGSVLVIHAAARAWGARPVGATLAAALFAGAPIVMRIATTAEVFALNNLIVACVLWIAAQDGPLRGTRRVIALALVAGLGLCDHATCTLVAPVGILGIVRGVRESGRTAQAIGAGVLAFVVGLVPYVYLIITPDTPLSWGKVHGIGDLIAMVTRRDYGGPGAFLPQGQEADAGEQLVAFAGGLGRTWLWLPAVLGLLTLGRAIAKPVGESRAAWICLTLSWLVAGPLLVMRFNIRPEGLGLYVVQRFHVLPAMLLAIPIAVGLRPLDALVEKRERIATLGVATLVFAAVLATTLPYLQRVHTPAVERYATNTLTTLPQNAVLFVGQDDEYFGIAYAQWALGLRHDVTVVAPQLTILPWYAERVAKKGIAAPPGDGHPMVRLVDKLLREGKPVFVEKARTEIIQTFTTYPYGTWMKVLPIGTPTPPLDSVIAENKEVYGRFVTGYPLPGLDDEFATAIHYRYAGTWTTLAKKLAQAGRPDEAGALLGIARQVGPQP